MAYYLFRQAIKLSLYNKLRDTYYMREMGTFRNTILLKLYLEILLKFTA